MGLGNLLSRIGRGAQKAAPFVQRGAAGVAASYGNRQPLLDLQKGQEDELNQAITLRNLDRQDVQDRLAQEAADRERRSFDTSQTTAGLQQDIARRNLALQPASPDDAAKRELETLAAKAELENKAKTTQGRQEAIFKGGIPFQAKVPVPPITQENPDLLKPIFGENKTTEMPPASEERFFIPKTDTSRSAYEDFSGGFGDTPAERKKAAEQWNAKQLEIARANLGVREKTEENVNSDRDRAAYAAARENATKNMQAKYTFKWLTMNDAAKEKAIQDETEKLLQQSPAPAPSFAGGRGAIPPNPY